MGERQEIQEQIRDLRKEIQSLREEVQEIRAIVSPISTLLRGNGFKMAVVLFSAGVTITMIGIGHLFTVVGSYLVQLVKAFR